MSGLKPITVNTAPEADPHIYAEDDAAIYQSIFGSDGVMTIGQQCASQVISNNKVRVKDGVIIVGGHVARIPYGEYIDCEIANGQSGVNRNDIIIAKFVTTGSGGIDTYTCEVKQGVAGSSASDPALTQNDLYAGGKIREMPLYRVKIEGLSIVAVEQLFKLVPTIPELEEQLAELNSKMPVCFGASETDIISFTAPYNCKVVVSFSCLGWGVDGSFLEFTIASHKSLTKEYEHTGGCDKRNGEYMPLTASVCFSGLKKGETYGFSRQNLYSSFGTSWDRRWSAWCIPE